MNRRHRTPQLPRRRRLGADATVRTIRIGDAVWRACLAPPEEWPDPPIAGREYVRLEDAGGANHWVVLAAGEFQRISNYRLRSLIMGFAGQDASEGVA